MPLDNHSVTSATSQKGRKFELTVAHPVRELADGIEFRIQGKLCFIDKRHFRNERFFSYSVYRGRAGERWVLKVQRWLVLELGLPRGVLVREVVDATTLAYRPRGKRSSGNR